MGAISTSEDGTTSLSKMDSPRLPAVWVRRILLPTAGEGEGEAEESAGGILRPPPEEDAMLLVSYLACLLLGWLKEITRNLRVLTL
jgi:hypothetical protein